MASATEFGIYLSLRSGHLFEKALGIWKTGGPKSCRTARQATQKKVSFLADLSRAFIDNAEQFDDALDFACFALELSGERAQGCLILVATICR